MGDAPGASSAGAGTEQTPPACMLAGMRAASARLAASRPSLFCSVCDSLPPVARIHAPRPLGPCPARQGWHPSHIHNALLLPSLLRCVAALRGRRQLARTFSDPRRIRRCYLCAHGVVGRCPLATDINLPEEASVGSQPPVLRQKASSKTRGLPRLMAAVSARNSVALPGLASL